MKDPEPPRVADPADLQRRRAVIAGRLFGPRSRDAAKIGRYTVLRQLGAGGMALVYAAYDESLDRKVALKLLHAADDDDDRRQSRLAREAKAMAKLSHVNVATVFETGMHSPEGDKPYSFIAIEFVDGKNLRQWLVDARDASQVLDVMRQTGAGLVAAHDAGLVHRDLKPENVMVRTDGVVKVLDFGVAAWRGKRELNPDDSVIATLVLGDASETMTVGVAGTPAYMAPEQLRGEDADARADQYSFCVTAVEALAGQRPFLGTSVLTLLESMEAGDVPELPEVPREVAMALRRGLSFDRDDRFESMSELLAAMRPPRSRRAAAPMIVAAVAGGLGVGALSLWGLNPDEERCAATDADWTGVWDEARRGQLEQRFTGPGQPAYLAQTWARVRARVDALVTADAVARGRLCRTAGRSALEASPEAACLAVARTEITAALESLASSDQTGLERAVDLVAGVADPQACLDDRRGALAVVDASTEFGALLARARAHRATGDLSAARELVEAALALLEPAASPAASAAAHALAAEVALEAADYGATDRHLATADASVVVLQRSDLRVRLSITRLALMAAQRSPDARGFGAGISDVVARGTLAARDDARLASLRASIALEGGKLEEAAAAADEAVGLGDALPPRQRGEALDLSARVHLAAGRYEDALRVAEDALALRRDAYGEQHPAVATSLGTVGAISLRLGRFKAARVMLTAARDAYQAAYGADHPALARTRANLGSALRELTDNDAALAEYVAARQSFERLHGLGDRRVAAVLVNESALRHELGEFEAAKLGYERALAILTSQLEPGHPHVLSTRANLGQLLADLGELDAAAATLGAVLRLRTEGLGPDHSDVAKAAVELGHVRLALGAVDDAIALYERALAIDDAALGPDHIRVAEDLASLSTAVRRSGDAERAEALARQVRSTVRPTDAMAARTDDQRAYHRHLLDAGLAGARSELLAERIELMRPGGDSIRDD